MRPVGVGRSTRTEDGPTPPPLIRPGRQNGSLSLIAVAQFSPSERDGNPEIYDMNADGSQQRNLTRTRGLEESGLSGRPPQK